MSDKYALDIEIAKKVMGLEVVGRVDAWGPSGEGWNIFLPEPAKRLHGELRPAYVERCICKDWDETPWGDSQIHAEFLKETRDQKQVWKHIARCLDILPEYSTEVGPAWTIVQKLEKEDSDLWIRIENNEGGYSVLLSDPKSTVSAFGTTLPLAICEAALLWKAGKNVSV